MKCRTPEQGVQDAILDGFAFYRWTVIRINTGMLPNAKGRRVRFAPTGTSDLIGVIPQAGRFLAVEVKRPGQAHKTTEAQDQWLADIRREGGVGIVADSVETIIDVINILTVDPWATFDQYGNHTGSMRP